MQISSNTRGYFGVFKFVNIETLVHPKQHGRRKPRKGEMSVNFV